MADNMDRIELIRRTVEIVKSFVSKNTLAVDDLPKLISETHRALVTQGAAAAKAEAPQPAVAVNKSVTPDYIICLEDGKRLKMLKRHLKTAYNMTPEEYRARWNLPADYPMVAPNYAKRRSELAKRIGLGTGRRGGRRR
jgi:predicted transcriptional regulator